MPPAVATVETIIFDLIHKPITKEIVTRILTHNLLTPEAAEQAVDVLYRKEALDTENYSLYLSFYSRHGDVEKVRQGIDKASEIYHIPLPRDKWHSSLARAYSAKGRVTDALRHLNLAHSSDPSYCDVRAHDAVVASLLVRVREVQDEIIAYKREKRSPRNADMGFLEGETDRKIKELLLLALETAKAVKDSGGVLIEKTLFTFAAFLRHAKLFREALEMVTWASQIGYPLDPAALADAQFYVEVAAGEFDEAFDRLQKIHVKKLHHYVALIMYSNSNSKVGDMSKWKRLCREIRPFGKQLRPPFFGKLIDMMGKRGALEEMEQLFKELKIYHGSEVSHIVYTSMITIYANEGKINRAYELYAEMRRHHVEPNDITYTALVRGFLAKGEFRICDTLLSRAQDGGFCTIAINVEQMIPYWAAHPGAMKRCVYYLKNTMRFISAGTPRNSLFNKMLEELANRGDMNACVELTHEMRAADAPLCARSYTALFRAAASAKLDGAYPVLIDGIDKDDVDVNLRLRIAMLRYAVALRNLELSTEVLQEVNLAVKDPTQGELTDDDKRELLQLIKEVSELREEQKQQNNINITENTTNNDYNTTTEKTEPTIETAKTEPTIETDITRNKKKKKDKKNKHL